MPEAPLEHRASGADTTLPGVVFWTGFVGVVALSGAMITGDTLEAEVASKPPFVLIHGTDDAVLASTETEAAAAKLTAAGIPVAMHLLPGLAHGIDERGIAIATEFMQGVLRPSQ